MEFFNILKSKINFIECLMIILCFIPKINNISTEIKATQRLNLNKQNFLRNTEVQNIYGSSFSIYYYYTNLYLGKNKQKQGLIIDTGSSITTTTCAQLCNSCGEHINPPYDINSTHKIIPCSDNKCNIVSSNCKKNSNCTFSISYSEGSSVKGVFINEQIGFNNNNTKNTTDKYVPIGCTISESNLFYKQEVNGIMGLQNSKYNFAEILYNNGIIKNNTFSICLAQLGGIFTLGEINNATHLENITFFPMVTDREKYFGLNIKSIHVENTKLKSFQKRIYNIFIDSGTTLSYFPVNISDEIISLTKKHCEQFSPVDGCGEYKYDSDFGHCFYFDKVQSLNYAVKNYWPKIHFNLNNYDYIWTPENYIFNLTNTSLIGACMGFARTYGTKMTLGSTWMIGHDIIFDRGNKRLGIAMANCQVNDKINKTSGLELLEGNNYLYLRGIKYRNIISLSILIVACALLLFMIMMIIWIIFSSKKQKKMMKKTFVLKIADYIPENTIEKKDNNNKNENYIKVSEDSIRSSNLQI